MDEELLKQLETKFADVQTQLKEAQDNGATKEEVLKLHESVKLQGIALQDFIESQTAKTVKGYGEQFTEFLIENKDNIQKLLKSGAGTIEFVPKAVGAIGTGNGGDGIIVPPPNMNTSLGSFNFRNDDPLVQLATVTSTSSPTYTYSELVPKDGDYTFVLEGAIKPQIDFSWQNNYTTPYKVAAYEILSEEVVTDIPRMESVAREYLFKKHNLFKASKTYFNTGSATEPKGATNYGRVFNSAGMIGLVPNANFVDAVNACVVDIARTHNYVDESPYVANVCLVNPIDFFLYLVAAKDANGLSLYPQAGLFNSVTFGGVTIRSWEKIPTGKMFVADMSRYNIANYIPFSIRIGWINDQFITNQFTMLGESRHFAYVKKLDEVAFIYDDIATVIAAIKPAP